MVRQLDSPTFLRNIEKRRKKLNMLILFEQLCISMLLPVTGKKKKKFRNPTHIIFMLTIRLSDY